MALAILWTAAGFAQKDVLLITLDTTRADHLSCYGNPQPTSPSMDAFAKGAVRFTRAYTPVPVTLPSHATLLTGLWPKDHGVRDNMTDRLKPSVRSVASLLKDKGYRTAAFISTFVLDHQFGLDRGFDVYDDRMTFTFKEKDENNERPAEATEKRVLDFLGGLKGKDPAFVWVHFYDPHHPYLKHPGTPQGMSEYDGEIRHMDLSLGRVIEAWAKTRRGLVILVGDHGESLGEHGERYHGVFLYEPDVRVPLLMAAPGLSAGTDDRLASTADVAATILDYAGLPAAGLAGRALLKPSGGHPRLFFESYLPANSFGWTPPFGILDSGLKYIHLPRAELYDLTADPMEAENLAARRRNKARLLRTSLEKDYGTVYVPPETAADPEAARKLAALGYRGGSTARADRDPKDLIWIEAEMDRGERLEAEGKSAEAEQIFRKILAANPENYPVMIQLGSVLRKTGRTEKAKQVFREALRTNPNYAHAHYNLGAIAFEQGDLPAAKEHFLEVLRLSPGALDACFYLVRIALKNSDLPRAREFLDQAAGIEPESENLFFYRGLFAVAQGDFTAAAAAFSASLNIKPDYLDAQVNLAQALYRSGRVDESIEAYRKALRLDPDQSGVYLSLASILLTESDDAAGALRYFQTFLDRYPNHPEAGRVREIVRDLSGPGR
jgi:arylsulfatase A-like enzyme/Tfp pilus assembly protein PilF